ncbi:hypothetical protein CUMW_017720 [Citrus unshiu]|nr:hypothetical protein CUMW_017720 [Citrus unshiu]
MGNSQQQCLFKKHRRVLKKRSAFIRSPKRRNNGIERRIKTLEKLVPSDKSIGLEALFGETADYIKCLQMKVKFMQIMVKLLSPPDE